MSKKLIIIRGLPGSGKSYLANKITNGNRDAVFEADSYPDFWKIDSSGKEIFNFKPHLLEQAHTDCFRRFCQFVASSNSDCVVSNTMSQKWEAWPYIMYAKARGIKIKILYPQTKWAWNPSECFRKNVHGVPLNTIRNMMRKWENHEDWRV